MRKGSRHQKSEWGRASLDCLQVRDMLAASISGNGLAANMGLTCKPPVFGLIDVMPKERIELVRI